MIAFLKRYWKYIFVVFSITAIFILGCIFYNNDNSIDSSSEKKLSVKKDDKIKDVSISDFKTVFVDVKGAVNAPGVYEIDSEKRIIDAINLAGGLSGEADTINLNLSKKVSDEMYIIVYTKTEIYNYKKDNENKKIECASLECVCPDSDNDACIKNDNNASKVNNNEQINSNVNCKVSINNASKEELMTLTGIGDAKADEIISYRTKNGLFKAIEDIKNVSGIGDAIFEKIKDKITL